MALCFLSLFFFSSFLATVYCMTDPAPHYASIRQNQSLVPAVGSNNTDKSLTCSSSSTLKEKSECLEGLLFQYYGVHFAFYCPHGHIFFATLNCHGCPWDDIPMNIVKNLTRKSFGPVRRSCATANFISHRVGTRIMNAVLCPMVIGLFLFSRIPTFAVTESDGTVFRFVEKHRGLKEPSHLLLMWLHFGAGRISFTVVSSILFICETAISTILHHVTVHSTYIILVFYTQVRLVRILSHSITTRPATPEMDMTEVSTLGPPLTSSVSSTTTASSIFAEPLALTGNPDQDVNVKAEVNPKESRHVHSIPHLLFIFWSLLLNITFVVICWLEGAGHINAPSAGSMGRCSIGDADDGWVSSLLTPLTLILEVAAIIVCSVLPQNFVGRLLRNVLLGLILVLSCLVMTLKNVFGLPNSTVFLGTILSHVSYIYVELTHAVITCLLGIGHAFVQWRRTHYYQTRDHEDGPR